MMFPSLTCLRAMNLQQHIPLKVTTALVDRGFTTLSQWGLKCPSLEMCSMPSELTKTSITDDITKQRLGGIR
jgi:hypothetical protein